MLLRLAVSAIAASSQDIGDDVTLLQLSKSPILEKDPVSSDASEAQLTDKLIKQNKELAYVEGLAHSVLETHTKIDESAKAALAAINETIDNSLELMNASHLTDQALLNTQAADVKDCAETFTTETEANNKAKKATEEMETGHSSCRAKIGLDDSDAVAKCNDLTNFLGGLTPPSCAMPADGGSDSVAAYWTAYKAHYDNNFALWETKDKACTDAKKKAGTDDETCDGLQNEYETAVCALNLAQLSSCHTYKECGGVALADFETTVEATEAQAKRRRIEWKAAVKIQCYIKILLADDSTEDSIEACQTMDPDVSHLILKVPEFPAIDECDDAGLTTLPCTDDFVAKYEGMEGINECTPCPPLPEYLQPACPEDEADNSATGWTSLEAVTLEASSSWSGSYLPDNLKKPDTNPWHCYGHGTDEWIKLTFEKSTALSGFRVKMHCGWDGSSFKNFKFQYSSDGNTWKDAKVGVGENQDCGDWQEITFPKKVGKYWRLYMVDNWGYGWLSIEQMEVQSGGSATPCVVTDGPKEWDETMSDVTLEASSSWSGSYLPDNMKKPDTNPWHCYGHGVNQWIKMTLPSATALSGFRVKMHCSWDGSSFKNYKFQYSSNGNDWQNAKEGVGENQDCGPWQEISFPTKTAKYWRLYMDDNWGYGWLSIEQMQLQKVLNKAPTPAATGPATFVGMDSVTLEASSSWSGSYLPDNMKTPDTNPWHDAQSGVNQWIKITLPEEQTLSGFRVKMHCSWDGSSFKDFMFQYSDTGEGEDWADAVEGVGENQDCGPWQEITFPPQTAKFWRLFMKNNHGYGWLSIEQMELQRIGAPAAGSAPAPPACEGSDAPVLYPTPGAPTSSTWGSSTLVLQYGKTAYTPTTEAVGTVGVGSDFAKLSDAAINAIQTDGDSTYDYFMFHSDIQTSGTTDVGRIFVRTKQNSYSDTGRNMGWGSDYWVCNKQDAASIDDCDSWTKGSCDRFDTQCVSGYVYDCRRWFMDYSGIGQCYNPSDTSKRCLSGNGGCKSCSGTSYGIRTNLRMYKFR